MCQRSTDSSHPTPPRPTSDAIHGILRLGTKYRLAPLRRRALQHLSSAHPTSLAPSDGLPSTPPYFTRSRTGAAALVLGSYAGPSFDPAHLELPILTLVRPAAFLRATAALASGGLTSWMFWKASTTRRPRAQRHSAPTRGGRRGPKRASCWGSCGARPTVCPGCVVCMRRVRVGPSPSMSAGVPGAGASSVMNPCAADRLAMCVAALTLVFGRQSVDRTAQSIAFYG
ncbi:hypothetical protein K438DRAFT_262134 [Mycena galopus ATCC 62051]|nr:hypothetical protein K438DRAFT_262134 [Mycena galopus ATCC 62051]